jgi:CBS domain-containing protein
MKVQELMSVPAVTCREGDSLDLAALMMCERDCGAIPVVDETDAIIGMITDRDICMAAHHTGRPLKDITVAEITSGIIFSVDSSDTVRRAEEIMSEHQGRRLPVVDARDRIVGMLSLNDIARAGQLESAQSTRGRRVTSGEVLRTLAAIGEPRRRPVQASARRHSL